MITPERPLWRSAGHQGREIMPVTISGVASGMDTDSIIQKLVKVEAEPIRQLEFKKKEHAVRKEALQNLQKRLEELNETARELYGFRASLTEKQALSSNKSILEANAGKNAEHGVKRIKVIQLASTHRINSDPMKEGDTLPAGKITLEVNGLSRILEFKGGTLRQFREKIDDKASDIIISEYTRTTGDEYVMSIESRVMGKKGEIKISGDKELLEKIGLTGGASGGKKNDIGLVFDGRYFKNYEGSSGVDATTGSLNVSGDGKSVTVNGIIWKEYQLPAEMQIEQGSLLDLALQYTGPKAEENDNAPLRMESGPDEKTIIKGIELHGYNISRLRDREKNAFKKKYDSAVGIGVISYEKGGRVEKIYPLDKNTGGRQQIAIGKDFAGKSVKGLVLYCNEGRAEFGNAKISTPVKDRGLMEPKNVITKAEDAKMKIDGNEITRDKNGDLNDVIRGVVLHLKKASEEEVSISIDNNVDAIYEKIKKFVDSYNKYLDYHKELIKTAKAARPGDYENPGYQKGLFVGDITITRLESQLKTTINNAYPSMAERPIRILAQTGVSTGAINASWETIKSGKLVIDEATLRKTIQDNPEGLTAFFGNDSDGDNRIDTGMAFRLTQVIGPYVSSGRNIIATKIGLEDDSIKLANENIKRREDHIKRYEAKLRDKFGRMERSLSETKSQQKWMNNQIDSLEGNNMRAKGK